MNFDMTLREALEIQEKQIRHYAHLYPGGEDALRKVLKEKTDVEGQDLDVKRSIFDVNQRVPRGGDIEHLCGVDFGGQ